MSEEQSGVHNRTLSPTLGWITFFNFDFHKVLRHFRKECKKKSSHELFETFLFIFKGCASTMKAI